MAPPEGSLPVASERGSGGEPTMRNFIIAFGLALVVPGALALVAPEPAQARPAETETTQSQHPIAGVLFGARCSEEPIRISGTFYVTQHATRDPRGGEQITEHFRLVASGIGVNSGSRYVLIGVAAQTSSVRLGRDPLAGTVMSAVFTTRYIAAGTADDYVRTEVYHLTVQPDATLVVEFDRVVADECR